MELEFINLSKFPSLWKNNTQKTPKKWLRKQTAKEVKTLAQSGNIQTLLVQLWCVKSNLHLSWDLSVLAGDAGSWAYTLRAALSSNNTTFDMSPFHSMLKPEDMKTSRMYNWIIHRIQRSKSFSSHTVLSDPVKYITRWSMGRGWAKELVQRTWNFLPRKSMWLLTNSITG